MTARWSAFVAWAAFAASAVFWLLRMSGAAPVAPLHTVPVSEVVVPHGDLTRLFGAEPVAAQPEVPALASRFHLLGVVAPKGPQSPAIALIAFDGKPPRAFRVGATIDGELVLQSVESRGVDIGPRGGPSAAHLDLPPLAPAATGSLPPPPPMNSDNAVPPPPAPNAVVDPTSQMADNPPMQVPLPEGNGAQGRGAAPPPPQVMQRGGRGMPQPVPAEKEPPDAQPGGMVER